MKQINHIHECVCQYGAQRDTMQLHEHFKNMFFMSGAWEMCFCHLLHTGLPNVVAENETF